MPGGEGSSRLKCLATDDAIFGSQGLALVLSLDVEDIRRDYLIDSSEPVLGVGISVVIDYDPEIENAVGRVCSKAGSIEHDA